MTLNFVTTYMKIYVLINLFPQLFCMLKIFRFLFFWFILHAQWFSRKRQKCSCHFELLNYKFLPEHFCVCHFSGHIFRCENFISHEKMHEIFAYWLNDDKKINNTIKFFINIIFSWFNCQDCYFFHYFFPLIATWLWAINSYVKNFQLIW